MATADWAVVVFVKEFQWDQIPQPLQNHLSHHSTKISFFYQTQLFPIVSTMLNKKKLQRKHLNQTQSFSGGPPHLARLYTRGQEIQKPLILPCAKFF